MHSGLTRRIAGALALAVCGIVSFPASAQEWPNKPIRLLLGFPPGGGADLLARILADKLSTGLGQPVVVENRPGQGGAMATEMGARAAPDGYTLLMANIGTLTVNPALYPNHRVDPTRDVVPISRLVTYSLVIFVAGDLPPKTLPELVALAKARPGTLNYGSAGNGGITHIAGELFKRTAGVDIVHVPYKGSGPAMIDVAGGILQMQIDILGVAEPFLKSGKVRALASTSEQRSPLAPSLPTAQELGVPFVLNGWQAIVAPAGTPRPIIDRLNAEVRKALGDPEVVRKLNAQGNVPAPSTPEELAGLITADGQRMSKVIRDAGIKLD